MTGRLGILRERAYGRFLAGETISLAGSQVTELALPLTAVLLLGATPADMGVLAAFGYLPFLFFGLLAGVWVDRFSRRRMLIATDLVGAAATALVPLAAVAHLLALPLLLATEFVLGSREVIGRVASQSFIPSLVGRERLVEANARLETASSVAVIAGPGLGGLLVQLVTAPVALVVDAVSYLCSAGMLATIRVSEPHEERRAGRAGSRGMRAGPGMREEIGEGLRVVLASPVLRAIMTGGAIHNLFSRAIDALFVIYAVNTLGLGPAEIGITIAVGGPGALLGSLLVGWLGRRVGVGRSIARLQVATGLARLLIPLAGPGAGALVLLGLSNFLMGLIRTAFNVTQVSLRVAMTEERLHGRVNATIRFVMWGVTPLGALAGGWLAASFGVRETLVVASIGTLFAFVPFTVRELRAIRSMPLPAGG